MAEILEAVKAISVLSVIGTLLEFLAPEGKLKGSVQFAIGIVFLFLVAEMIFNLF